ncbi:MAG: hypothetical protein ACR2ND_10275 [Solirubrobacteraceae bacterium]
MAKHRPDTLRILAAALLLLVGAVHFQQYVTTLGHVPTIGVLFLLNAAGAAALTIALFSAEPTLRLLALPAALGLVIGALISIVLAMNGGIFGYQEPTFRTSVTIAIIAEVAAIPALIACALSELHRIRSTPA